MTIGYKTLEVGEQALVYEKDGKARFEVGPTRIFLFRERFIKLKGFSADQNSYLKIQYKNGKVEHRQGPCVEFQNPIDHIGISRCDLMALDANEALVVYRQDEETGDVKRYVQYGPCMFMPEANEWLHNFSWHGTDKTNKTRKIPGALQFQKLRIIPDQFYYNVDEVRTADDALIRVKLMMFFELRDIEQMLNATRDPIGDFINCLCADVIAFTSKLTYMEFIEKSNELNDMNHYSQLLERCKAIGYAVSKVVFRGYFAHDKLQKLHDTAIEKRTQLKLAFEKEEQEQGLTDMKLRNEAERIELEHRMEIQALEHKHAMEKAQLKSKMNLELKQEEDKLKQWQDNSAASLQEKRDKDVQKLQHYQKLHDAGVDLTKLLLSENKQPDKVVKIVSLNKDAKIHLHQPAS